MTRALRPSLLLLVAATFWFSQNPLATAGKPDPVADRTISLQSIDLGQNARIQLMRADGTGVVTINNGKDLWRYSWPRWSPDGAMLGGYFKSLAKDDFGRMAMRADGSQEGVVVSDKKFIEFNFARTGIRESSLLPRRGRSHACWLGNGAVVFPAYAKYDASFFGETDPAYSSYGDRLFIADADGSIRPLTETPIRDARHYDDSDPHWSPLLGAIVFVSNRSGFDELYAVLPDGTGLAQISDFRVAGDNAQGATLFTPVWSPLADRLAVVVDFDDGYSRDLLILDVDLTQSFPGAGSGGRVTGLDLFKVALEPLDESPSWSPSGDRLLFHRYLGRLSQTVIADVQSGAETVVAETRLRDTQLVPDILLPEWKPVP